MGDLNFGESLGVAGASSLFNFGTSLLSSGIANKRSEQMSKELQKDQSNYQRQANLRAMSDKRASLEKAGINLNAESGFAPATAMPTASLQAHKADAPGFDPSMLSIINDAQLKNSQARLNKVNADTLQYDLDKRKSADAMFASVHQDDNGNWVISLPTITNKETFEAMQEVTRWNGEQISIKANISQDELRKAIADGQLQDNDVLQAFIKMPKSSFDKLLQDIVQSKAYKELLDAQTVTEGTKQELNRSSKNLTDAQTATEKERKDLVHNQAETEKERKDLVHNQAETEKERKDLVISEKNLNDLLKQLQGNQDFTTFYNKMKNADLGTQIIGVLGFIFDKFASVFSMSYKIGGKK